MKKTNILTLMLCLLNLLFNLVIVYNLSKSVESINMQISYLSSAVGNFLTKNENMFTRQNDINNNLSELNKQIKEMIPVEINKCGCTK